MRAPPPPPPQKKTFLERFIRFLIWQFSDNSLMTHLFNYNSDNIRYKKLLKVCHFCSSWWSSGLRRCAFIAASCRVEGSDPLTDQGLRKEEKLKENSRSWKGKLFANYCNIITGITWITYSRSQPISWGRWYNFPPRPLLKHIFF